MKMARRPPRDPSEKRSDSQRGSGYYFDSFAEKHRVPLVCGAPGNCQTSWHCRLSAGSERSYPIFGPGDHKKIQDLWAAAEIEVWRIRCTFLPPIMYEHKKGSAL